MSENQSQPPESNPTQPESAADLQLRQESSFPESIEKRQNLSPVSPHPLHIAEPANIPVLQKQMDPTFNSAEAHPYLANSNGAETAVSQTSNSMEPQQHQQSEPPSMADATNLLDVFSNKASVAHSYPNHDNLAALIGNGNVHARNGSLASEGAQTNGTSNSAKQASLAISGLPNPMLANSLPSNVDLQALLTKLSPATPTVPAQQPPTQTTPVQQNGTPSAVVPTSVPVQAPGLHSQPPTPTTASPNSKTHISNPLPQPTNHPLPPPPPVSVVSSSVPGHPPTGYPASLPPPPNFNQHKQSQQPGSVSADGEEDEEDSRPFTADEEDEFSRFLADERDYVTQGQWDRFPPGSRLFIGVTRKLTVAIVPHFIGNLPTEKVTKRDLFRIFHKHGRLAQVSIKQAYGFVQFLDQSSCASALRSEQGSSVRGRKMHLEISKPQRNTRNAAADSNRRRSRSPDYSRAASPASRRGHRNGRDGGVDRYRSAPEGRDSRDRRDRDGYSRDRSPARYGRRDDYRPGRRSRSRSPRYRSRSRTPPSEDDVPLPRRPPGQVPEVQILVSDELDRNFIWWVEQAFRQRGLTADMLFLNPRLQLSAVVKRQVAEGVMAVVFLNRQMQATNRISIQVFDRRGEGEATFDQYDNLDPPIAAELVVRSKQAHQPAPVAQYGGYGASPVVQQPQAQPQQQLMQQLGGVPNIAGLLGQLDPGTIQKLLAGLQQQQQPQQMHHQQQAPAPQMGADLASLLAGAAQQQQQRSQPPPQQNAYGSPNGLASAFGGTSGLAALLGQAQQKVSQQQQQQHQQQQAQQQPGTGQITNIMETLAKWKQS
ncbi:hypothetical protein EDC01DRAFT_748147 [Geopyxis carbonaria]|nr:hypothetical protein EDC01DRAFT_748147 [Geopyxis carbonaria]